MGLLGQSPLGSLLTRSEAPGKAQACWFEAQKRRQAPSCCHLIRSQLCYSGLGNGSREARRSRPDSWAFQQAKGKRFRLRGRSLCQSLRLAFLSGPVSPITAQRRAFRNHQEHHPLPCTQAASRKSPFFIWSKLQILLFPMLLDLGHKKKRVNSQKTVACGLPGRKGEHPKKAASHSCPTISHENHY